jgi:hypothetical protein
VKVIKAGQSIGGPEYINEDYTWACSAYVNMPHLPHGHEHEKKNKPSVMEVRTSCTSTLVYYRHSVVQPSHSAEEFLRQAHHPTLRELKTAILTSLLSRSPLTPLAAAAGSTQYPMYDAVHQGPYA